MNSVRIAKGYISLTSWREGRFTPCNPAIEATPASTAKTMETFSVFKITFFFFFGVPYSKT